MWNQLQVSISKQIMINLVTFWFDFDGIFLFYTILVSLASTVVTMDLENDVVQKNGKTYLAVKAVSAKCEFGNISTRLHSELHSPIINDLMSKAINTKWRSLYEKVQSEFEAYVGAIIQSIISMITDNVAAQDFFHNKNISQVITLWICKKILCSYIVWINTSSILCNCLHARHVIYSFQYVLYSSWKIVAGKNIQY